MKESQGKSVYLRDYRVPDYLIDATHLDVQLFEDHTRVRARLLMRRNPAASTSNAPLVLDGRQLELVEVLLDGVALHSDHYRLDKDQLTVMQVPERFTLETEVRIHPETNTSLEGLYKSRVMFCTQCEAEGFRKITYYLDRPDVLASFTTRVEADKARYPVLLSNGNPIERGELPNDRHFVRWQDPFRKPSYLFALVAGDLSGITDTFTTQSGRVIDLRIYVEAKDLDKCAFAMGALKRAMRWDEEVYGREYDLDIFMIVAVDDFNMGAMENKGLNIFNSSAVLAHPATTTDLSFQRIESIVAHEYFHNWSGNRVTCRDWFQLSLKEGFTVFRDSEFSADMGSRTVNRIEDVGFLRTVQFAEDSGPMAHSVRPESYMEISNFYTVTIYEKGAEVVRMLANLLGPQQFRQATDLYFARFDGQAVTTEDFVRCMEEVSGMDLGQFRRWYVQAGTPQLTVSGEYEAKTREYLLTVQQQTPPTPRQALKEPFFIPLTVGLLDSNGNDLPLQLGGADAVSSSKVLHVTAPVQTFRFTNIMEQPVPSLLRGFSAPVKLSYDYTREELMFLMSHDSDGFVRWEAGQQLALQVFNEALAAWRDGTPYTLDSSLVQAYREVLQASLTQPDIDKAMIANLILLPSEAYIAEQMTLVEVDGIHAVRESMRAQLARALQSEFAAVYRANLSGAPYEYAAVPIAQRALKNTVLNYLMLLESDVWFAAAAQQFERANNMTDESAALRAFINNPCAANTAQRGALVERFYQKWKQQTLVVEQWLSMQSAAPVVDNLPRVKALIQHEAFDLRNPNKVRSVIGAFCNSNAVGFHAADGSGYAFLGDYVIELNRLNPQIASRQLTPLTRWRRFDAQRQALMKAQLQRVMAAPNLSPDVYEVVSKSLQE
ncbi:MAG: aminopeptidase N [Pseudomonadales bacterium]|jgi:aminopeptidase N|nr:aminopeptidase N [Pseudomonadales bacterium]